MPRRGWILLDTTPHGCKIFFAPEFLLAALLQIGSLFWSEFLFSDSTDVTQGEDSADTGLQQEAKLIAPIPNHRCETHITRRREWLVSRLHEC